MIIKTIGDNNLNSYVDQNEKHEEESNNAGNNGNGIIIKSIKNLLNFVYLSQFRKLELSKSITSILVISKNQI